MTQDIPAPFQILNASAGSGKTYLLVQKYLIKLLSGRPDEYFNRLLALTFTNKAVFEMKYRILLQLHDLTIVDIKQEKDSMKETLMTSLSITSDELRHRAERCLQTILHDYAAFDVITLDSFTHRVIRTFAKDLGLAYNFDVVIEDEDMLVEIVDRLLNQVGVVPELTKTLEEFTYEKMEDDAVSSWELKQNLMSAAKLLLNENDRIQIQRIANLSALERTNQQDFLKQKQNTIVLELKEMGVEMLRLIKTNGLEAVHFSNKTLYNRFFKLSNGDFKGFDQGQLYQNMLDGKPLYPKRVPADIQQCIDSLSTEILKRFEKALKLFFQWLLIKDIKKQWIPLNLVTSLSNQLEAYQNETNKVLLSTFNGRIAKEILGQPTPYIYERLGENYRHYFLDEFQDTSSLQWQNLIPLIETALLSLNEDDRTGSVLLVGDPKQSIYRWRGGDVNQFINLIESEPPFQVPKNVHQLATNYRSAKSIVTFNNALYQCLPNYLIYSENKSLFGQRAMQKVFSKAQGYVNLTFFPDNPSFEENPYTKRIIAAINQCKQKGYGLGDMVVLVRNKKQSALIAKDLAIANIPTITNTSLRLEANMQVKFLASLVQLYFNSDNLEVKKEHLSFLYPFSASKDDLHQYLLKYISQDIEKFWKEEGIVFTFDIFDHRSIVRVLEQASFLFPGIEIGDPYVKAFLDLAFDFSQTNQADALSFLEFWELKKVTQSLSVPEESVGVRILTIHQSKGLEFPVVFFPYADNLIHSNHQEKVWLSTQSLLGDHLPLAWVSYSKRLLNYGEEGEKTYHRKMREEEMDAWNVFYVATTRASEQLYLFVNDKNKERESYVRVLYDLIPDIKIENDTETSYVWGEPIQKTVKQKVNDRKSDNIQQIQSVYPYEQKLVLQMPRSNTIEDARIWGLRVHDLLGKINYQDEIESVLTEAYMQGEVSKHEKTALLSLFNELTTHKKLSRFYSRAYKVLNEKSILVPKQNILRPDRVGLGEKEAYIIDYKTGKKEAKHSSQVLNYAKWVEDITQKTVKVFLVYLDLENDKPLEIVEIS